MPNLRIDISNEIKQAAADLLEKKLGLLTEPQRDHLRAIAKPNNFLAVTMNGQIMVFNGDFDQRLLNLSPSEEEIKYFQESN